ncbi:MAG: trypsin-like peptidase domain-containing protein [Elusimicrobiaceae bacterium]|nr:trypsin-like peptidase domain-containing protein [Elusimicrobiaceae bacterium]
MRLLFCVITAIVLYMPIYAKSHVEIAEENSPAIVAVNVLKKDGTTFNGTGFVVTQDGVIATSRHVVEGAMYLNVTFNTGVISGEAKQLVQAGEVDLALIKIEGKNLPTVSLGNSDYVLPGEEITVIGNPRRLQNTVTSGLISQVRKKSDGIIWHQISAPISPSSSGSPVFNKEGAVISVAFSSYKGEGNQNLNFSVPSNYLIKLLNAKNYFPPVAGTDTNKETSWWNKFSNHTAKAWNILCRPFQKDE